MKENGNLLSKVKYEANVPPFYYRPRPQDCLVLKEQWIRAKYQREEFTANKDISAWYLSGFKEGFLWKRGRDNKQFQSRKFVLSEEEGVLKYYMTSVCKNPKSVINLRDLNAIFQPEKIGHRNGLAFIFTKDSRTRTIFVYHENGEDIVDWFNSIRAARLRYLKKAFPDTPESELIPKITRNYVKEGYMEKTGPTQREPFKKRWFTLDSLERKLLYYKTPMCFLQDAYEQGGVFIGSTNHGYKVRDVLPAGLTARKCRAGISIETPERIFLLTCLTKNEQTEWIKALNDIISRPMTPQDYAGSTPRVCGQPSATEDTSTPAQDQAFRECFTPASPDDVEHPGPSGQTAPVNTDQCPSEKDDMKRHLQKGADPRSLQVAQQPLLARGWRTYHAGPERHLKSSSASPPNVRSY
ncbi:arf-GAP with dual PH domain-containing protein 2 isoform X3 [Pleurodeles waltl]